MLLAATPASASPDIGAPGGPLQHIYVGDILGCQVVFDDGEAEFFGDDTDVASCGTRVGDLELSATSQTGPTGDGSAPTPFTVVTVATTTDDAFKVTQTDTYVAGSRSFHTKIDLQNTGTTPASTVLWHGGDCTAGGSDAGYGLFDSATGTAYCSTTDNAATASRAIGFVPASSGSSYFEGDFVTAISPPGTAGFPNTCSGDLIDNGVALSWQIDNLAVGATTTRQFDTSTTAAGTLCATSPSSGASTVSITGGPAGSTTAHDATFTFDDPDAAGFQCSLDGAAFVACTSPTSYSGLTSGSHNFQVRALDSSSNVSSANGRAWTIQQLTLADLPAPVVGKVANVEPVNGKVFVALPLGVAKKGLKYVPLSEAKQIPVGSYLDTRKGTVALQTSTGSAGKTYLGNFSKGLFQMKQSKKKSAKGLSDLILNGGNFNSCKAKKKKGKKASAALSKKALRRLRGSAKGRFRTSGRYGAATVRGTKWTVTDRCDGTLTEVQKGAVTVRDFRRHKTVTVKTGKKYLAKAPH